ALLRVFLFHASVILDSFIDLTLGCADVAEVAQSLRGPESFVGIFFEQLFIAGGRLRLQRLFFSPFGLGRRDMKGLGGAVKQGLGGFGALLGCFRWAAGTGGEEQS